jgi:hypothetical protein
MVIVIVEMNIVDFIDGNRHLKAMYPDGISGEVLLGQIGFDAEGRVSLHIHTRQKPAIEIAKWGKWEKQFNVVVIKLLGRGGDLVRINNWKHVAFNSFDAFPEGNSFLIVQHGDGWDIELSFSGLIFQGCDVYLS